VATAARVLLVTASDDLAAASSRLAALAGAEICIARASEPIRVGWRSAELVLIGVDRVAAIAVLGLDRRPGVMVIADGEPTATHWRAALDLGASEVLVLPEGEQTLVEAIAGAADRGTAGGRVLGVVGGCGGAGSSTLAAALALTAGESRPTILIDADPLGGGLDVMLGAENRAGLRWPDLPEAPGRLDPEAFRVAACLVGGISVVPQGRGGEVPSPAAALAILDVARRAYDLVVIDLPRRSDDASALLAAAADQLAVIVPATVRAVAAAAALLPALAHPTTVAGVVVRDPGGGRLPARDVSAGLGLPLVATLRSDPAVEAAALRGEVPRRRGSLAATCLAVLAAAGPAMAAA
jgi:secretion/DNA translocation related CpaE-like protein